MDKRNVPSYTIEETLSMGIIVVAVIALLYYISTELPATLQFIWEFFILCVVVVVGAIIVYYIGKGTLMLYNTIKGRMGR